MAIDILVVLLLMLLNGLFSMSEMALVSSRRARLKQASEAGDKRATVALELAEDPNRFLSTVQIGITLVGVLTGAFGGATLAGWLEPVIASVPALANYADNIAFGLVVVLITYLTLILGELVPKRLAMQHPEAIAIRMAVSMAWLSRSSGPVAWALAKSTDAVLRLLRVRIDRSSGVTDEEIRILMREGAETGHFHEAERDIVEMALRLGDRRVAALMTPRTQMEVLDLADPDEENRRKLLASRYSRFPVLDGGLEKVVGVLEVKDLLGPVLAGQALDLRKAVKPAVFVPETAAALQALEQFKQTGTPIALIVDEYGDIQGLVTLNDLLESLVGEIGPAEPGVEPTWIKRDDGSWLIDGMAPIDEVRDLIGFTRSNEEEGDYQTLGGFMMAQLKRIPAAADWVEVDGYRFEVMDMDGRRVDKVLVVPPAETP